LSIHSIHSRKKFISIYSKYLYKYKKKAYYLWNILCAAAIAKREIYSRLIEKERERKNEWLFCTVCHFADFHSQISRRHFLGSMSREEAANVSIVANLQEKNEKKKWKSHGRSLPCATKNTPVEYRLTTVRSTGYFILSWKSNVSRCIRCVLGTTYEYRAAVLSSDNETDI